MTISEMIELVWLSMQESGISYEGDDEDLTLFALGFLKSNLDDAFEGIEET
jgi:hypothetical protein